MSVIQGWETNIFLWDVFCDGRVWKHFQKRIWVSYASSGHVIPVLLRTVRNAADFEETSHDAIQVLRRLVRHAANLQKHEITGSMDQLIELLTSSLSGVRYLIVLRT